VKKEEIVSRLKEYLESDYPNEKTIIIQDFVKMFLKEIGEK
jgi:putative Ca2+/H+ antiporter (TMEM165/GDT1 family)